MPFSETVKALLDASTDLTNVVGDKKYPLIAGQSTEKPYVVWQLSMTPTNAKPEDVCQYNYQVTMHCAHDNYDGAHEMSEIIRNHLDGNFANQEIAGNTIQVIDFEAMREGFIEGWDEFLVSDTYLIKVNT